MRQWELQELAGAALGLSEAQTTDIINGDEDFDTPLHDKLGVSFEEFSAVAEALIKLTPLLKSPMSEERNHAFVRKVEGGYTAIITAPSDD